MSDDTRDRGRNVVTLNLQKLLALKARAGEERTEYWDSGLKGFGVRVAGTGRKTFTVRYTLHGKQRRKDLGRLLQDPKDQTTNYQPMRDEALRVLSEAQAGRDPFLSASLLAKADVSTFAGICE